MLNFRNNLIINKIHNSHNNIIYKIIVYLHPKKVTLYLINLIEEKLILKINI